MHVTFLGAARVVTGSCYLLEHGKRAFLVDHGLFQGGSTAYRKNRAVLAFDAAALEFVLLTEL